MDSDDAQRLPTRLAAGLQKLALLFRHEAWHAADRRGLSPTQAQALAELTAASNPLRLHELAAQLTLTPGTVSEAVRALVEKGLVLRKPCPEDGRAVRLQPTAKGRREAERAGLPPQFLNQATQALEPTMQAELIRGLTALIRRLQADGRIPISGMCATCRYFRPHAHAGEQRPHHCAWLNEAIGDVDLRFDCPEHAPLEAEANESVWAAFTDGQPLDPGSDAR